MTADYFLHTPRLGFRLWSESDFDLAIGLWGDPEVTRLIGGPLSHEEVRQRLEGEIRMFAEHGVQYWPLFLLDGADHVGCCGLRPYDRDRRIFELGFHLRTAFRGQGYAREAARGVIGYAFQKVGAEALFAGHHPANEASRRLLLDLGFRYTCHEYYAPTGVLHPSYTLRR